MKKVLLTFIAVFTSLCLAAQTYSTEDKFTSLNDVDGKDVLVYDLVKICNPKNNVLFYKNPKGKLKLYKNEEIPFEELSEGTLFKEVSLLKEKNKTFVKLNDKYFLFVNDEWEINQVLRNYSYWENLRGLYSTEIQYVNKNKCNLPLKNNGNYLMDNYLPVQWIGIDKPVLRSDEITFILKIGETEYKVKSPKNYGVWTNGLISRADYVKDSVLIANQRKETEKFAMLDSVPSPVMFNESYSNDGYTFQKNSIVYAYQISNDYCKLKVMCKGSATQVPVEEVSFKDNSRLEYLKERGISGIEIRKEVARQQSLEGEKSQEDLWKKEYDSAIKDINNRQLFLCSKDYAHSEYSSFFGLELKFYNCFKKTIKYIEITTHAYNDVNDLQTDYLGKSRANVKAIGPLEPGEYGTYTFDEMFLDKYDVISYVYVTGVKFIFMDGTTRVFSGKTNVRNHMFAEDSNYDALITNEKSVPPALPYDQSSFGIESRAEFPGGESAMLEYLSKNLKYPAQSCANNIQGRVVVNATIEKDGSISECKVTKSTVDTSCEKEAIRLIQNMPKWKPAYRGGEPCRSIETVIVLFRLT